MALLSAWGPCSIRSTIITWCQKYLRTLNAPLTRNMSDLTGLPIPRMDWDNTNLPETWRKFQSTVELMFKGPLQPKDEAIKVSYLLLWVGERGREIADTWTDISEEDKKKLAPHYEFFRKHVQPKLNPIFSRYKFTRFTPVQRSPSQLNLRLILDLKSIFCRRECLMH